jgi:hypothetical protein
MKNIKTVLEGIYSNLELRSKIVPLFIGDAGLGKTVIIEEFAKEKGVKLVELITSQMSPFEISGIAMPDKDTKKMTYFNFDKLENLKDGDILFFDELLNGNPVVLNACLTILEQRRFISGKPLPKIMIVAAANPQGMTPLTPQIKERFVWYNVKFDDKMWTDYMFKKYLMPKQVSSKLCKFIKDEPLNGENFMTPRSIDKATNMIIKNVPTPYSDTIGPILSTLVENKLKEDVTLPNGEVMSANEKISWLNLIKCKEGIETLKIINEEVVVIDDENEILMLDEKDNIIGGVKDIEVLKTMYYFSDADIVDIEAGIKTHPTSLPSSSLRFFQKK